MVRGPITVLAAVIFGPEIGFHPVQLVCGRSNLLNGHCRARKVTNIAFRRSISERRLYDAACFRGGFGPKIARSTPQPSALIFG